MLFTIAFLRFKLVNSRLLTLAFTTHSGFSH